MDISKLTIGLSGISLLSILALTWSLSQYASRIKNAEEGIETLKKQIKTLETNQNGIADIAISIARIETRLDGIDKTLDRLENTKKETKNA